MEHNKIDTTDTAAPVVYSISFNQCYDCFTVGCSTGFGIYHAYPYKLVVFRRTAVLCFLEWRVSNNTLGLKGGITMAEMLFKTNILALIGGGPTPAFPPNKIIIWDDYAKKTVLELTFKSLVISVKLRKDIIVVATEKNVFAYTITDYKLIDVIDTCPNPTGILALSCGRDSRVIACPHVEVGYTRVQLYGLILIRKHNPS